MLEETDLLGGNKGSAQGNQKEKKTDLLGGNRDFLQGNRGKTDLMRESVHSQQGNESKEEEESDFIF